MHTPLTKYLYMRTIITVQSRQTQSFTHWPFTSILHGYVIFYTMHLTTCFDHFDHAHWVAIRCETSEATPMLAEASEAPCNEIVIVLSITPSECYFMCHTCACMYHQYLPAYLPANVCACVIILRILQFVKDGETALFKAAYYGRTAIIIELVEKGADSNIPNKVRLYKSCLYILLLISRKKGWWLYVMPYPRLQQINIVTSWACTACLASSNYLEQFLCLSVCLFVCASVTDNCAYAIMSLPDSINSS